VGLTGARSTDDTVSFGVIASEGVTATETVGPGFVTNAEVDHLLGTARTRERWEQRGVLPRGYSLWAYRQRLVLFPEFVLAPLVIGLRPSRLEQRALSYLYAECDRLYSSSIFRGFVEGVGRLFRAGGRRPLPELVELLEQEEFDTFCSYRAAVGAIERKLVDCDITFSLEPGRLRAANAHYYYVQFRSHVEARLPRTMAATALKAGLAVAVGPVSVCGRSVQYLLPAPPSVAMGQMADAVSDDEELLNLMEEATITPLASPNADLRNAPMDDRPESKLVPLSSIRFGPTSPSRWV
jgi:hypothetical protein